MRQLLPATLTALLLGWAACAPLIGQESDAESAEASVIDVLVTATRIEQSEEGVASHVTVIGREEIERYNVSNVTELLERAAGVRFRSTGEYPVQTQATMRGFGQGRVLVLVDGKRLNNPDLSLINWFDISLAEVERIEVLQGGQSVTYGDNAVAGVINVITRGASPEEGEPVDIDVQSVFGSFGKSDASLRMSGGTELLSVSAAYDLQRKEGQRERSASISHGSSMDMQFTPGSLIEVSFSTDFTTARYELAGAIPEATFKEDPNEALNKDDEVKDTQLDARLTLSADGGSWNTELPMYYTHKDAAADIASFSSFTGTVTDTVEIKPFAAAQFGLGSSALLQLRSGVDLLRSALSHHGYLSASRNTESSQAELVKASAGTWLKGELSWQETIVLSLGGRYELGKIGANSESTDAIDGEKQHTGTAVSGALLYRPLDGLELYTSANTLYRYPFLDEQVSYQGFGADFLSDLEAETGYSVDVGGRYRIGTLVSVEGSGYLLRMNNEIAYDMDEMKNVNLEATQRIGAELDATAELTDALSANAGYSYVRATFTEGPNEGNVVPLVPSHSGNLGVAVALPFDLSISGSSTFSGDYYVDAANEVDPRFPRAIVDATVAWSPSSVPGEGTVFVGIQNITDNRNPTSAFYSSFTDTVSVYPQPGRSWKAGLRWSY